MKWKRLLWPLAPAVQEKWSLHFLLLQQDNQFIEYYSNQRQSLSTWTTLYWLIRILVLEQENCTKQSVVCTYELSAKIVSSLTDGAVPVQPAAESAPHDASETPRHSTSPATAAATAAAATATAASRRRRWRDRDETRVVNSIQALLVTVTPVTVTNRLHWQFLQFPNDGFVSKLPLLTVTIWLQWHFSNVPTLSL